MIRKLYILAIWLSLCGSAFAQQVLYSGGAALTGQTLYFTIKALNGHADAGEYWNGSAWATYTTTRSTWKVAMSEVGVTGDFTGTLHSGAVGMIEVKIYQDANDDGTPSHTDDILLEVQAGFWNDGVFYTNALVSDGTGTGQINTASGVAQSDVRQFIGTALNGSSFVASNFDDFFDNNADSSEAVVSEISTILTEVQPLTFTVAGEVNANARYWVGSAIATPSVPGVPEVDMTHHTGTPSVPLTEPVAANVEQWAGAATATDDIALLSQLGSANFADAFLTAAKIATDAITNTKVAAGTITSSEAPNLDAAITTRLAPTTAGRTLDISAAGNAGVDWANVDAPSTSQNLSATTINLVNTATTASQLGATAQSHVRTQVDAEIAEHRLHELLTAAVSGAPTAGSFLDDLTEDDGGTQRFKANALETAPTGGSPPELLLATTLASVTSQQIFALTTGSNVDDAYVGQTVVLTDASNGDFPSVHTCTDYVGSTMTITVGTAANFTAVAGDGIKIFATSPGSTPPTKEEIRIEMDSNSTKLLAIEADTNELETDWSDGGRLDLLIDDVPTTSEFNARTVTSATYGTAANQSTILSNQTTAQTALSAMMSAFELDGVVYRLTTNSLEQAPTGAGLSGEQNMWLSEIHTRATLALPAVAPAANGGLPTVNGSNYVAGVVALGTNAISNASIADSAITSGKISASANNAIADATWEFLLADATSPNTFGEKFKTSTDRIALSLPAAAPAANGGLGTVDANNRIAGIQGSTVNTLDQLDTRILKPTVEGRTLDVTATGAAGIDWSNVENPGTAQSLTGTTIQGGGGIDWANLVNDHDDVAGSFGERFSRLPNVPAGSNGGLPTVDGNNRIAGIQGTVANTLDALAGASFTSADALDQIKDGVDDIETVGGGTIDPNVVGDGRTWVLVNKQQVMAPNIIVETVNFEGTLAMDFIRALNPGQTIQTVLATTVTAVDAADTVPTTVSDDPAPDRRFAHITIDASAADVGDYIYEVQVVTSDSQQITRRGRLRLQ